MKSIHRDYIEEIALLTVEEAKKLPKWVLANGEWWWLQSAGYSQYCTAFVNNVGWVNALGYSFDRDCVYVRPALKIKNLDLIAPAYGIEIGETVRILDRIAFYTGNGKVLLCEPIGVHRFDEDTNCYENSEIKEFLENWLKKEMEK